MRPRKRKFNFKTKSKRKRRKKTKWSRKREEYIMRFGESEKMGTKLKKNNSNMHNKCAKINKSRKRIIILHEIKKKEKEKRL